MTERACQNGCMPATDTAFTDLVRARRRRLGCVTYWWVIIPVVLFGVVFILGLAITISSAPTVTAYLRARPCPAGAPATATGCLRSAAAVITGTRTHRSRDNGTDYIATYRTADGHKGAVDSISPAFSRIVALPRGSRIVLRSINGQVTDVRLPDGATLAPDSSPVGQLRFGLIVLMVYFGAGLILGIVIFVRQIVPRWFPRPGFVLFVLFPASGGLLLALFPATLSYFLDLGSYVPALAVLASVWAAGAVCPVLLRQRRMARQDQEPAT